MFFDFARIAVSAGSGPPAPKPNIVFFPTSLDQEGLGRGAAASTVALPGRPSWMSFNAHCKLGEEDVTTVVGTKGTLRSRGPGLNDQPMMEVHLEEGSVIAPLKGSWFESGFQGTMGELLCAIEDGREPSHGAKDNLRSLELCFASLKSADSGQPIKLQ